jgi:hypothetical protein
MPGVRCSCFCEDMNRLTIVLFLYLLTASAGGVYAQGWRGIVPLHSTRADVERLLGPATGECKCFYQTGDELLRVEYARTRCKGYPSGWSVSAETVLEFSVRPERERPFSELRLDESKYEKAYDDALFTYYASRDEGIQYTVSHQGVVTNTRYIPSSRDSRLRCPCFPAEDGSIFRTPPYEAFSNQSLENALARLDNFAIQLSQVPDRKGYVVVYAGKRTPLMKAKRYSESLRKHLVERRGPTPK